MYGDTAIGAGNLMMVALAQRHSAVRWHAAGACAALPFVHTATPQAAKFPGSGGAVIVLPRATTDVQAMLADFEAAGCVAIKCHLQPAYAALSV